QTNIQENRVVGHIRIEFQGFFAVLGNINRIRVFAQCARDETRHLAFVFHKKDAHDRPLLDWGTTRDISITSATWRDTVHWKSFRNTWPPFMTNFTRSSSVMSLSGSPDTAIMSAYLPFSTEPMRFCQPIISAATDVAV